MRQTKQPDRHDRIIFEKKEKQTHRNHGKKKQQPRKAKQKLMKKCTRGIRKR